jgi:DNA-binding SARP family transcriptional activator
MLTIELLGGCRVSYRGGPLAGLRSPRVQALLAYLVLHRGTAVPRAHVAALFWPDTTDAQSRTNLRKLLSELRQALPDFDRFVSADGHTLRWRPDAPFALDVAAIEESASPHASTEALDTAVSLYREGLLPGFYDEWVVAERERIRQLYLVLLERAVAEQEARRNYPSAIAHAQRLVAEDPLREESYRLLMRLHAVTGDRAGAVRAYHACAAALQRELNVAPGPSTREAYERLLSADAPRAATPLADPALIGRTREWALLLGAWKAAASGTLRVAVVRGEAGVGKTRLASELLEWAARQGVATTGARCIATEGLAYAPVAALLRGRPLPPMDPAWRAEVARLLPELGTGAARAVAAAPNTAAWQRRRLFDALARAMLGSQPLLLVLDDLQWCDEDSLAWFDYLLRTSSDARLLLVTALRPEEAPADHPAVRMLASWNREGWLVEIDLGPLDADATARLAASVASTGLDAETASHVYRWTGGNPLFIIEMARAGLIRTGGGHPPSLPPRVQEVIRARIDTLSPAARTVAEAAAAIGRPFTFPLLAGVADMDEGRLVQCVDELWRRRILREHGVNAYDFNHELVRASTYSGLGRARGQWLHRRIAETLEALHRSAPDEVAAEIAAHFELADLPARAAPYQRLAAEAASRVYANEQAVAHYERLVPLTRGAEQIAALRGLGETLQRMGRWNDAEDAFRRALGIAERTGGAHDSARCRVAIGRLLVLRGAYTPALEHLEIARAAMERVGDATGLGDAVYNMGIAHWYQGAYADALACYERALGCSRAAGDRRRQGEVVGHIGLVYYDQRRYGEALDAFDRYMAIAAEVQDKTGMIKAANNAGTVHEDLGQYPRAIECYGHALRLAEETGERRSVGIALCNIGVVYRRRGDYPAAQACLLRALDLADAIGDPWLVGIAAGHLARAYSAQERYDIARRLLDVAVRIGRRLDVPYHLCKHLCWAADLALSQQRAAEAAPLALEAERIAACVGRRDMQFAAALLLIRIRRALGETATAEAVRDCTALLEAWSSDRERAAAHYEAWRLDGSDGHRRAAVDLYRSLYTGSPLAAYRRRYEELTGDTRPAPPPLPELPEVTALPALSAEAVLTRIEAADAREAEHGPPSLVV